MTSTEKINEIASMYPKPFGVLMSKKSFSEFFIKLDVFGAIEIHGLSVDDFPQFRGLYILVDDKINPNEDVIEPLNTLREFISKTLEWARA